METEGELRTFSFIDPYYTSGEFFQLSKGAKDAEFKVRELRYLLEPYLDTHPDITLKHVADVGCGSGGTTFLLSRMLLDINQRAHLSGYDIHPAMQTLSGNESITFHYADFTQTRQDPTADLVVLFDVIEHVPDPSGFLRAVGERARLVALHIPLDNSWLLGMRNLWRTNLRHPGHLIVLNAPSAINLVTFSGLRIEDYRLTPVFRAPSGKETRSQRFLNPIRHVLYRISPYILQTTLGGVSLMVLATTAHAYEK